LRIAYNASQKRNRSRIVGRSDFLFIAGTIAVAAGLLFPMSAHILDVLLIFSVSLTTAVLIITFCAQGILEVSSFPLLILVATMLRVALSVASARLILSQGNAGTIVGLVGDIIVQNHGIPAILIFGILAVVIFGTICKAVKSISRTSREFTTEIVPIKRMSIDGDLSAGVISNEQAVGLQERIGHETSFFIAMAGAARFMLCSVVIEFVIIMINASTSIAMVVVGPTSVGISAEIYATLAVGAGMVTQISAVLTAVASRYLVQKGSVVPVANHGVSEQEFADRIKVVANEVTCPQPEIQYRNTVGHTELVEHSYGELAETTNPGASADVEAEEKAIAEDTNWFDEAREDDFDLWVCEETNGGDYYEAIAELIESKSGVQLKTILMGAESAAELPVTVPVNIAMRLAQRDQKCLLVDLDLERGAISKVFDIDTGNTRDKVGMKAIVTGIPTCVKDVSVWPVNNFGKGDASSIKSLKEVIASLEGQYDRFIMYVPNIKLWADWDGIAGCVQAVMLFGRDPRARETAFGDCRPEGEVDG